MKAVIIGGGIIGLSAAFYLQKDGWEVTLVDKSDLSDSCSYGNLGMVVPSHFVPLAAPGMVAQGIRWMFNSKSPFYVKPSLSPSLISWGLKFVKSATAKHVADSATPLLDINLYSRKLYEDLQQEPGFGFAYEKKGILMYYKTEKVGEEEVHLADKARSMGLEVEALNKQQAQALEPNVELDVLGAVHYKCDAHLYPGKLIPQLLDYLKANGAVIRGNTPVKSIEVSGGQIKKIVTDKEAITADLFVLASGSWLPQLAKMAGITIPLMPGKGYSFTHKEPTQKLNVPAILCEARVAITPMNGHMRYGGTMEIAPVNDRINMNRVQGIVESVPKYFPGIKLDMPAEKEVWYGFRPCSPDGLPYIGYSKQLKNLIIAGGHAMMGLSLGPATGKVVADLASHKQPDINVKAFDANRFS
ncbi:D-amino-acid dehydrogenase [Cnuella takakiae]|uniref:D-amino-acid dehydrogenase n=1 Tax=Cnuella takakiae TaxID=1302690 RepID=A0A1M4S8W4_9BACT|nr:FAD-dependent oxidoreductase [Cnuella takakiae]OLY94423.1 amino acid dehydrogenase [Cnuella takakiae]SHE28663.1 D-amino-acid dehydrogenase [Cnuella takakiae]